MHGAVYVFPNQSRSLTRPREAKTSPMRFLIYFLLAFSGDSNQSLLPCSRRSFFYPRTFKIAPLVNALGQRAKAGPPAVPDQPGEFSTKTSERHRVPIGSQTPTAVFFRSASAQTANRNGEWHASPERKTESSVRRSSSCQG